MRILGNRWLKLFFVLGFVVCGIDKADRVWTDCDYCQNITSPIQTCSGTGSSSCNLYYSYGQTYCCSNSAGKSCQDYQYLGPATFYYRYSAGNYCIGYYKCAGRTTAPCSGDVIIPSSSDCTPYGPIYGFTSNSYTCN